MSKQHFLIGLTGMPGSGKDTVAGAMSAHGFRAIAFADALRVEVSQAWRLDPSMLTTRHIKELPLPALAIGMCCDPAFIAWGQSNDLDLSEPRSPRWVLQRWGTEFRRGQRPDYWLMPVAKWIGRRLGTGCRHLVVTDVRLPNEGELIHGLGGVLLHVLRPELSAMRADTANHASEQMHGMGATGVIRNDGDLQALPYEVRRAIEAALGAGAVPNVYRGFAQESHHD